MRARRLGKPPRFALAGDARRGRLSDQQDRRSRGLARGEIGLGLGGVPQRIGLVDLDFDRA